MAVANQDIIIIGEREPFDTKHAFGRIHSNALQQAMIALKGETLKLWLYLNKNQSGFQLELSQKACEQWGIKKDAYYTARKKLIALGYLVPKEEGSNIYTFYEVAKPSGKPKDSDVSGNQKPTISGKPKDLSGNQKEPSGKPKDSSGIQQRNTINTINTIDNTTEDANTIDLSKEEYSPPPRSKIIKKPRIELEGNPCFYVLADKNTNKYYIDIFHQDGIIYEVED